MRRGIAAARTGVRGLVLAAVVALLVAGMAGCHPNSIDEFRAGMEDEPVYAKMSAREQPLVVTGSGWLVPQGSRAWSTNVHFGVEIENTDEYFVVNGAVLRVLGIDANGVLKLDSRVSLPVVFAGEKLVLAGIAPGMIEGAEAEGLQVLFAVEDGVGELRSLPHGAISDGDSVTDYDYAELAFPEGLYQVSELVADQYGRDSWTFSGTVTLSPDVEVNERLLGEASVSCVQLSLVFRDEAGAILCGNECIVDGLVAGEPAEFMFDCILPYGFEYASVEVYARPWTPGAALTADWGGN